MNAEAAPSIEQARRATTGDMVFAVIVVDNCQPGSQRTLTVPLDAGNDFALRVEQDFGPLNGGPIFYLSVPSAEIVSSVFAPLENLGRR